MAPLEPDVHRPAHDHHFVPGLPVYSSVYSMPPGPYMHMEHGMMMGHPGARSMLYPQGMLPPSGVYGGHDAIAGFSFGQYAQEAYAATYANMYPTVIPGGCLFASRNVGVPLVFAGL